jgi:hypothetical protein
VILDADAAARALLPGVPCRACARDLACPACELRQLEPAKHCRACGCEVSCGACGERPFEARPAAAAAGYRDSGLAPGASLPVATQPGSGLLVPLLITAVVFMGLLGVGAAVLAIVILGR